MSLNGGRGRVVAKCQKHPAERYVHPRLPCGMKMAGDSAGVVSAAAGPRPTGPLPAPGPLPPRGPVAVKMNWDGLLFLHWEVDAAALRRLVPEPLEIDTFDGRAYVGLVPFAMADCSFRGVPRLPGLRDFYECNVRTYVRHGDMRGVWFFSLDAQTLLPVLGGRWMWNLNYVYSRFAVQREGAVTDYRLSRRAGPWPKAETHVRWETGGLLPPRGEHDLATFLTERYWLFTKRRGSLWAGHVRHEPWPLREAQVLHIEDSLIAAAGLSVSGEPIAFASEHVEVEGFALERVGGKEPNSKSQMAKSK